MLAGMSEIVMERTAKGQDSKGTPCCEEEDSKGTILDRTARGLCCNAEDSKGTL